MDKDMLIKEYNFENAKRTLIIGKILSFVGILVIFPILFIESSVYHSLELIISRLLFIIPAVLFLLFTKTLFKTRIDLIIPFHAATISGGVAMMVGVTLVKFQITDINPAYRLASVNGGLITAIFMMYIFSAGAKKYFKFVVASLLSLLLLYFLLKENLTWLETSPFINPLSIGLGVFILCIYSERLEYQEFKMRKLAENTKTRLEEELKQKKQLEEKLHDQAMLDDLTGVFNRRASYNLLDKCLRHTKKHNENCTICYIDVDNLKLINDSYGHSEGDNIIVSFVKIIKNIIRDNDYICRIGGDEFLLILPNCTQDDADVIVKRIRKNLRESSKYEEVDFSHGFSEFKKGDCFSIHELIELADKRMYENKVKKKEAI